MYVLNEEDRDLYYKCQRIKLEKSASLKVEEEEEEEEDDERKKKVEEILGGFAIFVGATLHKECGRR